jgi:hypothetical protein
MTALAKYFGVTVDDLLRSSLSILVFLLLVGGGLWFWLGKRVSPLFFAGYVTGGLWVLYVNSRNSAQDKTFSLPGSSQPATFQQAMDQVSIDNGGVVYLAPDALDRYLAANP